MFTDEANGKVITDPNPMVGNTKTAAPTMSTVEPLDNRWPGTKDGTKVGTMTSNSDAGGQTREMTIRHRIVEEMNEDKKSKAQHGRSTDSEARRDNEPRSRGSKILTRT